MPLFPLFVNLEGKNVLVVGGGKTASRKIKGLLPFKANIVVVADKISQSIMKLYKNGTINLFERKFRFSDLNDKDMVIAAIDDIKLQKSIYEKCKAMNVAINCVDSPSFCSFIFPSLVIRNDLVIGISTSAKAPSISKEIRKMIAKMIPKNIGKIIEKVADLRASATKGKSRRLMIKQIVAEKFHTLQPK